MKSKLILASFLVITLLLATVSAMAQEGMSSSIEDLTKALKEILNVNTVFGEPVTYEGITMIPVCVTGFGFGVNEPAPMVGMGGGGGGVFPIAVIAVSKEKTEVIPVTGKGDFVYIIEALTELLKNVGPMLPQMLMGGGEMGGY